MKANLKRVLCILLVLVMCAAVAGCASGEQILSVYSETDTIGNNESKAEDTASKDTASKDTASKDTASKDTASKDTANKDTASKDTASKKPSTTTPDGKFNPYAGIEEYKGKTVNVALWWDPTVNEQKIIDKFTDKYDISVNVSYTPIDNYATKFMAEIASKSGPDVVFISYDNYLNFINNGLVQTIDAGNFDLKNDPIYDDYVIDLFSHKGKIYGVNSMNNMTFSRWMLYYNKTMFDNAGVTDPGTLWKKGVKEGNPNKYWNWDSFADCAKKLSSRKNGKTVYGYTGLNTTIGNGWMLTTGSDYVTTDGKNFKNNLTSDPVLKTLTFVSELRQQGYWSPDDSTSGFYNGTAAMLGEGSWSLEAGQAYWKMKDKVGCVPLPCPANTEEIITYGAGVWCLATGAKQPEAASYFIRHWIDYEASIDYTKQIPGDAEREVFMYMSDLSKKRQASVAQAVMGYYEKSTFWKMLNVSREKPNDVPVVLKSVSALVDGYIAKLEAESK